MAMKIIKPQLWKDYELIDSGNFEKLERFGMYTLRRPEPQAVWDRSLSEAECKKSSHATFRALKMADKGDGNEPGEWSIKPHIKYPWTIQYSYKSMKLSFMLTFKSFKHVGIFPENAGLWNYIYDTVSAWSAPDKKKVLNLFAYTGGASLAARAAGADVFHVDSVPQVISWSKTNMEASGLSDIRWVVEDVLKFVQREVNRGKKYDGIILNPPAFGRGPKREKWKLEDNINDLLKLCSQLLAGSGSFVLLNLYSLGFSPLVAENLLKTVFGSPDRLETGELFLPDNTGRKLPMGIYSLFNR